jgi:hypothetical protein
MRTEDIEARITDQLARSANRPAWAQRADLIDVLKGFTVAELLPISGLTGRPKRADIVAAIVDQRL